MTTTEHPRPSRIPASATGFALSPDRREYIEKTRLHPAFALLATLGLSEVSLPTSEADREARFTAAKRLRQIAVQTDAWEERLQAEKLAIAQFHDDDMMHVASEYVDELAQGPLTLAEYNTLAAYDERCGEAVINHALGRLAGKTSL